MSTARLSPPSWDFGTVINLVNALYPSTDAVESLDDSADLTASTAQVSTTQAPARSVSPKHGTRKRDQRQLGNFDNVWKYLGAPLNASPPAGYKPADQGILTFEKLSTTDFGSSPSKGVTWQDRLHGTPTKIGSLQRSTTPSSPSNQLSKKQKKQLNRQQKRAASEARTLESTSDGEDDAKSPVSQLRQSSDRQQVIQKYIHGDAKSPKVANASKPVASLESPFDSPTTVKYHLRNRDVFEHNERAIANIRAVNQALEAKRPKDASLYMNQAQAQHHQPRAHQLPVYTTPQKGLKHRSFNLEDYQFSPQDHRTPSKAPNSQARASSVLESSLAAPNAVGVYNEALKWFNSPTLALRCYYRTLLEEKLIALFPFENLKHENLRPYPSKGRLEPRGIHVFVDASNVSLQFYHALSTFCRCLSCVPPLAMRLMSRSFHVQPRFRCICILQSISRRTV